MIDHVISAELPTEAENPTLRAKVKRLMIHSNTHLERTTSRCNKNGKCIYGFPQKLRDRTVFDEASARALYRRRKEEDRWVAPYLPFLVDYLDCHVNIDYVSGTSIFMYLYKYLFKGPDQATYSVTPQTLNEDSEPNGNLPIDETKDFIRARYLSASEAAWRILRYDTIRKSIPVQALAVHLPGEDNRQLGNKDNSSTGSTLLHYFARPRTTESQDLKYAKFYATYLLGKYTEFLPHN